MELDDKNLKKINKTYNKDKAAYEKAKGLEASIKTYKEELKQYNRQKEDYQTEKKRAREDKDKAKEKICDQLIEDVDDKIDDVKRNIKEIEQKIKQNKERVDSHINELNKDPEFQAHMNSILEKKYNRARNRAIKEKEQINLIIEVCEKHPALEMNLKGIIRAAEECRKIVQQQKKLKKDLKTLDPIKDAVLINQIQTIEMPALEKLLDEFKDKGNTHEEAFMAFCEKSDIPIDKDYLLDLMVNGKFSHDKGKAQPLISLKKMTKGYDKKITNYEKCIAKIPGAKINQPKQEEEKEEQEEGTKIEQPIQEEIEQEKGTKGSTGEQAKGDNPPSSSTEATKGTNLPDKKYDWWEFGKRFKAWQEKRKVKKAIKNGDLPKEDEKVDKEEQEKVKPSSKFRAAYKYDVVKDYIDNQMNEIYKEVIKEAKKKDTNKEEAKEDDDKEK